MASPAALTAAQRAALSLLTADLRRIFGGELRAVVAFGLQRGPADGPLHTLVLAARVDFDHLASCAPVVHTWRHAGLAVPLLMSVGEFERTLDVFPLEYDQIVNDHVRVEGEDPFAGIHVPESDLRRACELQAKSHLIHLREGFLECSREPGAVANLIASSAPAFRTLLANIARLERQQFPASDDAIAAEAEQTVGVPASLIRDVLSYGQAGSAALDPTSLLARYIPVAEQIWRYVDLWRHT
jgi:hypothetical protein